jgi:uncharacterized protein (TIGR00290 family)
MNWSGGKDSALCLYRARQEKDTDTGCLLTSVNSVYHRISMHGVRRELLVAQAESIGLPLRTMELPEWPGMAEYEAILDTTVAQLKAEGYTQTLFGDIFLEDLRRYRENQLARTGITCRFPLWGEDTRALMEEFIGLGFKALVVCVNGNVLDASFCGRELDASFLEDLPAAVDPCGERGEYHTFVYDGPLFRHPVAFERGDLTERTYPAPQDTDAPVPVFYFQDLLPAE